MSPPPHFPGLLDAIYGIGPPVDLNVKDRTAVLFWFANPHLSIEKLAAWLDVEPQSLTRLLGGQEGRRVIDWLLINYGRDDLGEYRLSGEHQHGNCVGIIRPPLSILSGDQRKEQIRVEGKEALDAIGSGVNNEED